MAHLPQPGSLLGRAAAGWVRYWFGADGRYSLAAARVGVGLAFLLSLHTYVLPDYRVYFWVHEGQPFRPASVLRFCPALPPPAACEAIKAAAVGSCLTLLVGLFARTSLWVALLTNLVLVDVVHGLNGGPSVALQFQFLALLGLAFGDVGARWSVDAWRRARRGQPEPPPGPSGTRWPVYLAQLMVCLFFFSAFFNKWKGGGFTLDWALSDNLRNWLVLRFDVWDEPRTAVAEWAMDRPWVYQAAGVGNLVSQALPILACACVDRPWARLAFGGFFLLETLGLGLVIGFWCFHWLPLLVLFVDWEAVRRWALRRRGAAGPDAVPAAAGGLALPSCYILLLASAYGYFAFLSRPRPSFPFQGVTAFSGMLVAGPAREHRPYEYASHRIEVDDRALGPGRLTTWLYYNYRGLDQLTDPDRVRQVLALHQRALAAGDAALLWEVGGMPRMANWDPAERRHVAASWDAYAARLADSPGGGPAGPAVSLKKAVFEFPAYPAEPRAEVVCQGLIGRLDPAGGLVVVTADQYDARPGRPGGVRLRPTGLTAPAFRLGYCHPATRRSGPLTGTWDGNAFAFDAPPPAGAYLLIYVTDPALGAGEHLFLGPVLR